MSGPTGPTGGAADGAAAAPHCYRHPDRETYISCQRCGRPICPDCMRPASVGYQCPECVAEGNRSVRRPRTAAGGLLPQQAGAATMVLIVINVVAFVAELATGGSNGSVARAAAMLGQTASDPATFEVYRGVADGAWWRPLTNAFVHDGFFHIALNMYALYLFGPLLERWLGTVRFVAMYLTAAIGASLVVYLLAPPNQFALGASGAVFGLFGVALVMMFQRRYDVRTLLVLLAINGAITFLFPRISWEAHVGGLAIGLVLGAAFAYAPRQQRTAVQAAVFAALWIAMVAGYVLRTMALTG